MISKRFAKVDSLSSTNMKPSLWNDTKERGNQERRRYRGSISSLLPGDQKPRHKQSVPAWWQWWWWCCFDGPTLSQFGRSLQHLHNRPGIHEDWDRALTFETFGLIERRVSAFSWLADVNGGTREPGRCRERGLERRRGGRWKQRRGHYCNLW